MMRTQWLVIALIIFAVPISAQFIPSSGVTITPASPVQGQETTLSVNGWTYVYNQIYRWNPALTQWQLAGSLDGKQAGWSDLSQATSLKFPASTSTLAIFACNPVSSTRFDCNGNVDIDQAGNIISNNAKWMLFRVITQTATCVDSDGGKIYDVKGTVGSSTDSCTTNVLTEHYCENGQSANENIVCPNGCFDGMCAKTHVIKFYIEPTLVDSALTVPHSNPDPAKLAFAGKSLTKYVDDMNTFLAKNTNRRFLFNPDKDLVLFWPATCSTDPANPIPCKIGVCMFKAGGGQICKPADQANPTPIPTENFEVWAHVVSIPSISKPTDNSPRSYGGNGLSDSSGAGVLGELHWTKIFDPDALKDLSENQDYWVQINNMIHEFGHVLGAAVGEYYNLATIDDKTGTLPTLNIRVSDQNDPYWSAHPDFIVDPMLANVMFSAAIPTKPQTRAEALKLAQFSKLTAAIASGSYRTDAGTPDITKIQLLVKNSQGVAVTGADVTVYRIQAIYPSFTSSTITTLTTDANGGVTFGWSPVGSPFSNSESLRLIKVSKGGQPLAARYVSIFDAQIAKIINKQDPWIITMTVP